MNDRDPDEIDLEQPDRYRYRGPAHARKRKLAKQPKPEEVTRYKGPTYHEPMYGDSAAELPTSLPAPPRPKREETMCAGVPDRPSCGVMIISRAGNKKRCGPCSYLMTVYRQREGAKRRAKERKKAKMTEGRQKIMDGLKGSILTSTSRADARAIVAQAFDQRGLRSMGSRTRGDLPSEPAFDGIVAAAIDAVTAVMDAGLDMLERPEPYPAAVVEAAKVLLAHIKAKHNSASWHSTAFDMEWLIANPDAPNPPPVTRTARSAAP